MSQFALQYPWLIPLLPLLACLFIGAFGFKLKGFSHIPAILAMVCSFALALTLLLTISGDPSKAIYDFRLGEWFSAGNIPGLRSGFSVPIAFTIDQLTALYLTFITGIGLLIFIYAAGYMKGDFGYWRFFAYLSIFVFFMTVLVMGNNLIMLYLGWEGVGLASYLLIGYYYPRPTAVAAAKKAFITNRIGDFGLAIGIFIIYKYFGSVEYTKIFTVISDSQLLTKYEPVLYWIPFCLMLGAFGKSAQFPLHVWLPDAMEGPTPVSALIHAATMVTAGIYLIARTMPLFTMYPGNHDALNVVAIIGGFTAFLAASIALCQYDLKRIWAYSTLSQLGYMFLALGMTTAADVTPIVATTQGQDNITTATFYHLTGPAAAAVFHVFTHAFFKALLFLSAGSVMHAMGGELDIRKMSGVRKVMPITNITMLIGCIALAGFPGFAGFFSKDEIIHAALNSTTGPGFFLGILALIVALMTAYYTFRLYFKVFTGPLELPPTAGHHEPSPFALATEHAHGAPHGNAGPGIDTVHAKQGHEEASHGEDEHGHAHPASAHHEQGAHGPNDGSPLMWLPLLLLSLGAIGAGYLGFEHTGDWIHKFLAGGSLPEAAEATGRISHNAMMVISSVIAIVGIGIAFYFYKLNRHAATIVGANLKPLVAFLYNKWYIDEIYNIFITRTLWVLAHLLSIIDKYVIDGLVFMVGFTPQIIGYTLKPTQRGILQRYAVGMIAGLAILILVVLYMLH